MATTQEIMMATFFLCYYNDKTNGVVLVPDPRFDDRIAKEEFRDGIQDDMFFGVKDQVDLMFHGCMWTDERFDKPKACLTTKEFDSIEVRGVTLEQATILFAQLLASREVAGE